jgi:hypothetical protein
MEGHVYFMINGHALIMLEHGLAVRCACKTVSVGFCLSLMIEGVAGGGGEELSSWAHSDPRPLLRFSC